MNLLNFKKILLGIMVAISLNIFIVTFSSNIVGRFNFTFTPFYSIWKLFEPFWTIEAIYWFMALYFILNLLRYYFGSFFTEIRSEQSFIIIIPSIVFATFEIIIFGFISIRIYSFESFVYLHICLLVLDIFYIDIFPLSLGIVKKIINKIIDRKITKLKKAKEALKDATKNERLKADLDQIHTKIANDLDKLKQNTDKLIPTWRWQNIAELFIFIILLFTYKWYIHLPLIMSLVGIILLILFYLDFKLNWKNWRNIFKTVFEQ